MSKLLPQGTSLAPWNLILIHITLYLPCLLGKQTKANPVNPWCGAQYCEQHLSSAYIPRNFRTATSSLQIVNGTAGMDQEVLPKYSRMRLSQDAPISGEKKLQQTSDFNFEPPTIIVIRPPLYIKTCGTSGLVQLSWRGQSSFLSWNTLSEWITCSKQQRNKQNMKNKPSQTNHTNKQTNKQPNKINQHIISRTQWNKTKPKYTTLNNTKPKAQRNKQTNTTKPKTQRNKQTQQNQKHKETTNQNKVKHNQPISKPNQTKPTNKTNNTHTHIYVSQNKTKPKTHRSKQTNKQTNKQTKPNKTKEIAKKTIQTNKQTIKHTDYKEWMTMTGA